MARKPLINASPDKRFWLKDGRSLRNLAELDNAFSTMNVEVFSFHVNKSKNDFVPWIRDVLADPDLARKISRYKSIEPISKIIHTNISKNYLIN